MPRVGIITDSVASLPKEAIEQYSIEVVPLNIYYDGTVYRDGVDITPTEAYQLLAKDPDKFATSPGSAGDYFEAYQQVSKKFQNILCITLSSKLSTLYNMAHLAQEEAKEKLPQTKIEVLDSLNAATGEGLIVLAAARAAGEERSLDEVIEITQRVKEKISVIGIFETIRHVYRTGRIPKIAARTLSALSIKPMFSIFGGLVHITSICRIKPFGLKRLLNKMRGSVGAKPIHVFIAHADVPDEGEKLKEQLSAEFNCVELWLSHFSPIMGYATGKGTLIIAYYPDEILRGTKAL